ncbi:hypothetical protein VCHC52A1_3652, partial [Vibrio cholerae HC-52A1]
MAALEIADPPTNS